MSSKKYRLINWFHFQSVLLLDGCEKAPGRSRSSSDHVLSMWQAAQVGGANGLLVEREFSSLLESAGGKQESDTRTKTFAEKNREPQRSFS